MAMIASQRSVGKSSILATNWMPALFTRISSDPSFSSVSAIIAAIWSGLRDVGPGIADAHPVLGGHAARSLSISAASPKPLIITSAPAAATARAIPSPMPLVAPVIRAALPLKLMACVLPLLATQSKLGRLPLHRTNKSQRGAFVSSGSHLPEFVQRSQIVGPRLIRPGLRPVGPRYLADIEIAARVHRQAVRREELGRTDARPHVRPAAQCACRCYRRSSPAARDSAHCG